MSFKISNTLQRSNTRAAIATARRSMPLLLLGICVTCSVAAFVTAAHAEDIWDPPWIANPSDPQWAGVNSTTTQTWDFDMDPALPIDGGNPFGQAEVEFIPAAVYPSEVPGLDPEGGTLTTWLIDQEGGTMIINIPNDPISRARKVIFLQITSTKAPKLGFPVSDPVGTVTYPNGPLGHDNTDWYTYNAMIDTDCSQQEEWVTYSFPAGTNIEELIVDTICIDPVPEPGTATMLVGVVLMSCIFSIKRRRTR